MTERNTRNRQFVERDLSGGTPTIIFAGNANEDKERRENRERIAGKLEVAISARGRRTRGRGRWIKPKE